MAQIKSHRYTVVDVFTTEPLAGNPLAVFPDASALGATTMQKIAKELNLPRSEERRVGKECRMPCRSRWSPYH